MANAERFIRRAKGVALGSAVVLTAAYGYTAHTRAESEYPQDANFRGSVLVVLTDFQSIIGGGLETINRDGFNNEGVPKNKSGNDTGSSNGGSQEIQPTQPAAPIVRTPDGFIDLVPDMLVRGFDCSVTSRSVIGAPKSEGGHRTVWAVIDAGNPNDPQGVSQIATDVMGSKIVVYKGDTVQACEEPPPAPVDPAPTTSTG
jgi:hypothetical protein